MRFISHGHLTYVRKVGGDTLKAALASVEDICFTVVVTNITGPLQNQDISSVNADAPLVSLQGIDANIKPSTNDNCVMIWLFFSWKLTYTLQDDQVKFENALKAIGRSVSGPDFLRPN